MESPSGRLCEEITNRCRVRIASTICAMSGLSGLFVIILVERGSGVRRLLRTLADANLVEELLDPVLAGDRLVVDEIELGDALQPQARADLAAQKRHRPLERARAALLRLLVAERRVVDASQLEIGRDLDAGDGDEAEARVVHFPRQQQSQLAAYLLGNA